MAIWNNFAHDGYVNLSNGGFHANHHDIDSFIKELKPIDSMVHRTKPCLLRSDMVICQTFIGELGFIHNLDPLLNDFILIKEVIYSIGSIFYMGFDDQRGTDQLAILWKLSQ